MIIIIQSPSDYDFQEPLELHSETVEDEEDEKDSDQVSLVSN